MTTTAAQYRAMFEEDITLPSGAVFRIRKISSKDFIDMGGELPIPGDVDSDALPLRPGVDAQAVITEARRMITYVEHAVIKGTVEPKLTYARDAYGDPVDVPDKLHHDGSNDRQEGP